VATNRKKILGVSAFLEERALGGLALGFAFTAGAFRATERPPGPFFVDRFAQARPTSPRTLLSIGRLPVAETEETGVLVRAFGRRAALGFCPLSLRSFGARLRKLSRYSALGRFLVKMLYRRPARERVPICSMA